MAAASTETLLIAQAGVLGIGAVAIYTSSWRGRQADAQQCDIDRMQDRTERARDREHDHERELRVRQLDAAALLIHQAGEAALRLV